MVQAPQALRDHWWWRPGWRQGRSFYTWHVTFAGQPVVGELAAHYAPVLSLLPFYDPIPVEWLHLTTQGVGFADDVRREDLDAIIVAVQRRLATLEPFTVTIGPAQIDAEALGTRVRPEAPIARLRSEIRAGIAQVWGEDGVPDRADGFWPHVSLGYCSQAGPSQPAVDALASRAERSVEVTITEASLIDLDRDTKLYRWTEIAAARLGG